MSTRSRQGDVPLRDEALEESPRFRVCDIITRPRFLYISTTTASLGTGLAQRCEDFTVAPLLSRRIVLTANIDSKGTKRLARAAPPPRHPRVLLETRELTGATHLCQREKGPETVQRAWVVQPTSHFQRNGGRGRGREGRFLSCLRGGFPPDFVKAPRRRGPRVHEGLALGGVA